MLKNGNSIFATNGYSQQKTKYNNTMLIFNLIRRFGPISRIKLAKKTGLSATTVSMLVEDLMIEGYIVETGCEDTTTSGRKPISLQINGGGGYICVIEVINTGLNCYLYDLACELVDKSKYRIKNTGSHVAVDIVNRLLSKNSIDSERLIGINIDYPGIVDNKKTEIIYSAVLSSDSYFGNTDISDLKCFFPNAVIELNNDSNVAAYTAFLHEEKHSDKKVLYLNMFECIGAGCIISNHNGEMINEFSIEFGHVMVDSDGPKCKCGGTGCLELEAGTCEILRRINEETDLEFEYSDEFRSELNLSCMKMVGRELSAGNEQVKRVLGDIALKIAIALSNVINIIDPSDIFIGGQIAYLGDDFIDMVKSSTENLSVLPSASERIIHKSVLDYFDCYAGAANMIIDKAFATENN